MISYGTGHLAESSCQSSHLVHAWISYAGILSDFLGVDPSVRVKLFFCDVGSIFAAIGESTVNGLTTCNRDGRRIEPINAAWNLYISGIYRGAS